MAPGDRRERQRWFPLAGLVPEVLLGQAGRFVPWRELVEFPAADGPPDAASGVVVGLPASAPGFERWEPAKRRRHLLRLLGELAARGVRALGLGRGFARSAGGAEAVREAAGEVLGPAGGGLVAGWAGRLSGSLAGLEFLATTRGWECEQAEVLLAGGETPAGRVAARLLARRFGRLTLAGEGPPLRRLGEQILHETGTAARVGVPWGRAVARAQLVALAAPLPEGAAGLLRAGTVVVELVEGVADPLAGGARPGRGRSAVVGETAFSWPGGAPSTELPGVVWGPAPDGAEPLVSSGLAVVAALGAAGGVGPPGKAAEDPLRLAGTPEPTLAGVDAVRAELARQGFRPAAVLDKGGTVLL